MKNCLMCGEPLQGKRADSKYCSNSCKAKHWELRKAGKGLSGTVLTDKAVLTDKIIPLKAEDKTDTEQFITPLSNVLNDEPGETDTKRAEIILPEKFIMRKQQEPNPVYQKLNAQLSECSGQRLVCEQAIERLKQQIKEEENRSGTMINLATTGSGAILGYNLGAPEVKIVPEKENKGKKKTGEGRAKFRAVQKGKDNRVLYAVLGSLFGFGLGKVINSATEAEREKSKAENIRKYKEELSIKEAALKVLKSKEMGLSMQIFGLAKFITKEVKILNPAYTSALQEQTKAKQLQGIKELEQEKAKRSALGTEYAGGKIVPMQKVTGIKHRLLNFKDKWRDFFGLPQINFFCVIHGMSGEGKSTFAMQFAKYLAENFGIVLFVSGEEGFAPTFQDKVQKFKSDIPGMYGGDIRTGEELLNETPVNKFHFIVIDSLNNMGIDPEMMRRIRAKFKHSAIIAICQNTKDGKMRGSYEIIHDSDITVKVTNGIALTTKNRFKEKNMEFDVFAELKKMDRPIMPVHRKTENGDQQMDSDLRNTI
jgi:hypothetical protein